MGAVPLLSEQDHGGQQHGASVFVSAAAQQLTASSSSCCSSSSSSSSAAASSATTASAPGAVWGGGVTTTSTINSLSSTSGSGATTGPTPTGMPLPAATIFHNTGAGSCTTSGVNGTSRGGTSTAMGGGGQLLAGTTTSSTSSTSSVIFTAVTTPSGDGAATSSSATNRMSSNSSAGGGTSGPPVLVHNNFSAAHTPKSSELSNSQTRVNAVRTPPNCGSETPPAVGHSSSRNSNHGDSNIMGTSGDLNKSKRILRLFSPLQGPGRSKEGSKEQTKKSWNEVVGKVQKSDGSVRASPPGSGAPARPRSHDGNTPDSSTSAHAVAMPEPLRQYHLSVLDQNCSTSTTGSSRTSLPFRSKGLIRYLKEVLTQIDTNMRNGHIPSKEKFERFHSQLVEAVRKWTRPATGHDMIQLAEILAPLRQKIEGPVELHKTLRRLVRRLMVYERPRGGGSHDEPRSSTR
ncbi:unnamed protein product [Amoebophrya sp. A120]|nr:unnamed protein product [Amoebophrya sp. A120]|eukprot:GSA120T00008216001.1